MSLDSELLSSILSHHLFGGWTSNQQIFNLKLFILVLLRTLWSSTLPDEMDGPK